MAFINCPTFLLEWTTFLGSYHEEKYRLRLFSYMSVPNMRQGPCPVIAENGIFKLNSLKWIWTRYVQNLWEISKRSGQLFIYVLKWRLLYLKMLFLWNDGRLYSRYLPIFEMISGTMGNLSKSGFVVVIVFAFSGDHNVIKKVIKKLWLTFLLSSSL